MPWGRSKGRGLGDITGWASLLSSVSSHPLDIGLLQTLRLRIRNTSSQPVTLLSWSPSLPFVGKMECASGYAQRYLSFWLLIHQL